MPALAVTKMHGTLNDFIILDRRAASQDIDAAALARALCDRRAGMGADGLLIIESSIAADARMRIINADGSEAEMCGNGMRCAVRYLSENGEGDVFRVETIAGIIEARVMEKGDLFSVRLDVGKPAFERRELPFANADFVWVGNPHVVLFVSSLDDVDILHLGQQMPDVNVHVAQVVDRSLIKVQHHERGVGITHACGTGAVACAVAG